MIRLEASDVDKARSALAQHGPAAMYDILAAKGDQYALLANGVARGDSVAGVAAISYMKVVAADAGRPLVESDIDAIRVSMAQGYLAVLGLLT